MAIILGIIPARGGSVGIPDKNIAILAGKPLIAHSCVAALASARLDRVIVSTDSDAIAAVARKAGVDAPFLRPKALAGADTPILPVLKHVLAELRQRDSYEPDAVVLLQPTSPFRRAEHIDAAIEMLERQPQADGLVSVTPVPHCFNPASVMRVEGGAAVPWADPAQASILRRQDKPMLYGRNGPAILALRRPYLMDCAALYEGRLLAYEMDRASSIDIDEPDDLVFAEALVKGGYARLP